VLEIDADVRSRTWFLLGDLVDTPTRGGGEVLIPQPVLQPSMKAASGKTDIASAKALPDACGCHRYAETLIYEGVTPDDLRRVVYTQGEQPSEEVRAFARTAQWKLCPPTALHRRATADRLSQRRAGCRARISACCAPVARVSPGSVVFVV
jgi:hypothetical protein